MMLRTFAAFALLTIPACAQSLDGSWLGTVKLNKVEIPFRFEIESGGANLRATFFNGEERFPSTKGSRDGESIELRWQYFAATLKATVKDGKLDGVYERARSQPMEFHAVRQPAIMFAMAPASPNISGVWDIHDIRSSKGEKAWRLIVRQDGAILYASILRVDGDTGVLSGAFENGRFVLSHFSGMRPARLEITKQADGSLKLALNGGEPMTAIREAEARAKGLPEPDDPSKHTGVKDSKEPLHFNFPDLSGKMVSDADARFRNKVVLVNITGSWCPNCHDEAPFLEEMYAKYRAQGLEIVALSFEEEDQLKNPTRLRAFLERYGIDYTVLLGGTSDEAAQKLPQAEHWDAWPTTFFVARNGRVRAVHAGFPSKASGDLYTEARRDFTREVEQLLAESALSTGGGAH